MHDAGLFFICYQRDPRAGFVKIYEDMAKLDAPSTSSRPTREGASSRALAGSARVNLCEGRDCSNSLAALTQTATRQATRAAPAPGSDPSAARMCLASTAISWAGERPIAQPGLHSPPAPLISPDLRAALAPRAKNLPPRRAPMPRSPRPSA
jgi:hypothetical protein